MKISTQFGVFTKKYGPEVSLKMLGDAGFESCDYSLTANAIPWETEPLTDRNTPEFNAYFENILSIARKNNVEIGMTHAPYCMVFRSVKEEYELNLDQTIRAVYATKLLECPYIVVHPVLHPDFNNGQEPERAFLANIDYFTALVPALKETGVVACVENLYWGERKDPKTPNSCTTPEQLIKIIDTLNEMHGPYFAACLDTGHATISGEDAIDFVQKLGDRLRTLHINDNYGVIDNHVVPGKGVIDWAEFMKVFKASGYKGTFNFEPDGYHDDFNRKLYSVETITQSLKTIYLIGKDLLAME